MGVLNRSTYHPKVLQPELVEVSGHFFPNGVTTPANTSNEGYGWKVTRTDVGLFEVEFAVKFTALLDAWAGVGLAAAADTVGQVGAYTAPTASAGPKLVIRTLTAGAAADIAANANNRVFFRARFRNTHVKPFRGL